MMEFLYPHHTTTKHQINATFVVSTLDSVGTDYQVYVFVNPDISGDETKAVFSMVLSLSLDGSGQRPVHGTWDLGPTSFVSIKLQLKTGLRP